MTSGDKPDKPSSPAEKDKGLQPEPAGLGPPVEPRTTTGKITVCVTFEISGLGTPVEPK